MSDNFFCNQLQMTETNNLVHTYMLTKMWYFSNFQLLLLLLLHYNCQIAPLHCMEIPLFLLLHKAQKELPVNEKREIFQYEDLMMEGNATNMSTMNLPSNQILHASKRGERLFALHIRINWEAKRGEICSQGSNQQVPLAMGHVLVHQ